MNEPKYKPGDFVSFVISTRRKNTTKIGQIYIVDANGTFEQNEEPSYDIAIPRIEGMTLLIKHIRESSITKKHRNRFIKKTRKVQLIQSVKSTL